ncbi:MAG: hypothetical protein P4L92_16835 [Rudaea sp.]|nr:hypothetical protein [Rudaea sp.]
MTVYSLLRTGYLFCALAALAASLSSCPAAEAPLATASISVGVEGAAPQQLDAAALAKLPQHQIHAEAHGKTVACEGPTLIDVLTGAGAPGGDKLRGRNLELYVRISAADGYHAVFALAELDPGFRDDVAIVTNRCDGAPLDAKDGPFRLVVPGEKRRARWVRQVTAIDLLRAP